MHSTISIISKFKFINNFADNLTKAGILVFDVFPPNISLYIFLVSTLLAFRIQPFVKL